MLKKANALSSPTRASGRIRPKRSSLVPETERLQNRLVPSVAVVNGSLVSTGTDGADDVSIGRMSNGNYRVVDTGQIHVFTAAQLFGGQVTFDGGKGNDQ